MDKQILVLVKIFLGLFLAIILSIAIMSFLSDSMVSQNKTKKIAYAQYSGSKEFLSRKVTKIVMHYDYNVDSSNIVQVIDSVYIIETK